MPNQALSEALSNSASGFNSALQSIMQTTQNLQKAQYAKQQMAAKLEQQKNLIDYRTDAQIRAKQEVYETVEKPQAVAEKTKAITESFQNAVKKSSELRKKELFENPASEYKLLNNIDFQPDEMPDGTFSPQPFMISEEGDLQQLSQREFDYMQEQAKEVALVLQDIESRAEDLDEVDGYYDSEGNLQVGSNNYKDIIRSVQREGFDGNTAKALLAADYSRSLSVKTSPKSETQKTWLNSAGFEFARLAKSMNAEQTPIINITNDEGVVVDDRFFREDIRKSLKLNLALPYTENKKWIEDFTSNFEVDMSKIPLGNEETQRALREAILTGNVQTLEDNDVPDEYVNLAEGMNTMREALGERQFQFMTQYYTQVPTMWEEAVNEGYLDKDLDKLVPNFNFDGQINNLFVPIEEANKDVTYSIQKGYSYFN